MNYREQVIDTNKLFSFLLWNFSCSWNGGTQKAVRILKLYHALCGDLCSFAMISFSQFYGAKQHSVLAKVALNKNEVLRDHVLHFYQFTIRHVSNSYVS
jgi:hypothetical protein